MSFWHLLARDPEPLQRPRLAGGMVGIGAAFAAAALVWATGSADPPARAIGIAPPLLVGLSIASLGVAGAAYGAVFLRAANDRRGGWLFGLGWGFLTWALGPITLCQWILGKPVSAGWQAAILLAGHLLWGLLLGTLFPFVQSRIEMSIDKAGSPRRRGLDRRARAEQAPRDYKLRPVPEQQEE
jgi:MFS family permease